METNQKSHRDRLYYYNESERNPDVNNLLRGGVTIADYVTRLGREKMHPTYSLKDHIIRCMDERTPGGIRIAGGGILSGINDTVAGLQGTRIDGITRHVGCGAEGIFAQEHSLNPDELEQEASAFQHTLAMELGVPAIEEKLAVDPSDLHIARVAWFANVDFDPDQVAALPKGFVMHRHYQEPEHAKEQLALAPVIAMGEHGFGEWLSKEKPFWIFVVASNEEALEDMKRDAEEVRMGLPENLQDRVRIDGFIADRG